jgi:hypothetical protein
MSIVHNFDENWAAEPNTGCHLWLRCVDGKGYGIFKFKNKIHKAHRFAYERKYGPIPKGKLACHFCDTPSCCRPEHVWIGTDQDNADDKMRKRRHPVFSKTHCPQGHPYSGDNLRIAPNGFRRCRICEREICNKWHKENRIYLNAKKLERYYANKRKHKLSSTSASGVASQEHQKV